MTDTKRPVREQEECGHFDETLAGLEQELQAAPTPEDREATEFVLTTTRKKQEACLREVRQDLEADAAAGPAEGDLE